MIRMKYGGEEVFKLKEREVGLERFNYYEEMVIEIG